MRASSVGGFLNVDDLTFKDSFKVQHSVKGDTQTMTVQATINRLKLFSGSSHVELAQEISNYFKIQLSPIVRKRFADGELYIQLNESVRGCDIYLVQPTCYPAHKHLEELLFMIDACRRASARQITAVIPYYGYGRGDRLTARREPIPAKLVANLLTTAGVDRLLAMDLHSPQIQGYFDIPLDHVYGSPVILDHIASKNLSNVVVVSPDVGGLARARAFAKKLKVPLAIIDKRRYAHNQAEVLNVIGDVQDKTAVLVDDMIDTAGTISEAARILKQKGVHRVYACATHAVFSAPAIEQLSSGIFEEVIVTNTIPISPDKQFSQLTVLSVANLLGEAIWRTHKESSVSSMFD